MSAADIWAPPEAVKVVTVVQARLGSQRFPRKVLAPVLGRPVLAHLIERLRRAVTLDHTILAIPHGSGDDELAEFAAAENVECVRGSETDVLDRYWQAATAAAATIVVRVTGDCPLVDPAVVDALVRPVREGNHDYAYTGTTYPKGFDVEVFTIGALRRAWLQVTTMYDREHVTPFLQRDRANRIVVADYPADLSAERVTLDYPEDLQVIAAVFKHFAHNRFGVGDVAALMRTQPALFEANRGFSRAARLV